MKIRVDLAPHQRALEGAVSFLLIDGSIKYILAETEITDMPRIGMEPLRRKALVDATLRTIGQRG